MTQGFAPGRSPVQAPLPQPETHATLAVGDSALHPIK